MKISAQVLIVSIVLLVYGCTETESPEPKNRTVESANKAVKVESKMHSANEDFIGFFLTPEQEQCIADYPALKAENIRAGITIGGVTGTATEYADCSETVKTACITNDSYPAVKTDGLAAKVLTGQTVAGVSGTAIAAKADCTGPNQTDCITTAVYKSLDLRDKDAGGALDLTNSNFIVRLASASIFEYWDETGARHTNTGDADLLATNIYRGIDILGNTGTAVAPDCSLIPSEYGTWILVPGDPDYGTNGFCVMKYEAKNNSGVPASTPAGAPWVSIDQQDSITECASLGKGYHLITNDEWMTIATNITAQGANWDGGVVGTNEMTTGHSDSNPDNACAADASDANAYVETNCTGSSSGTFNQRRTHYLSNGEVIWDLAGNVQEWTSYFNDADKPSAADSVLWGYPISSSTAMPATDLAPNNALKSFWDNTWSSTQGIGKYWPGANGSGGGLLRGGDWNLVSLTPDAGVFAADMALSPTGTYAVVGFRCAASVP